MTPGEADQIPARKPAPGSSFRDTRESYTCAMAILHAWRVSIRAVFDCCDLEPLAAILKS